MCIISLGAFSYNIATGGVLISTNVTGSALSGVQKGISNISIFFSNVYSKSFEYEDLVQENRELKEEVSNLESELRANEYAMIEKEELRNMVGIKEYNPTFEFEISEVVGRSVTSSENILTLDKGTNVGIEVNDLVITNDGVVGFISSVGYNYASVTTVLDEEFTLGGIVTRSRVLGIVKGEFELGLEGFIRLTYLDKNSDIEVGDTIETSGVSGTFPKGMILGTVTEIQIENQGVSKCAIIEPFVDFENINQVYIIKEF